MVKKVKKKNLNSIIKRSKEPLQLKEKPQLSEQVKKTKIKIVGIGGGAGNIISEIAPRLPKISFVAINTDLQALKEIDKRVSIFQIGQNLTNGLGTGMNVDLAATAALQEKEKIKKIFSGYDLCILIASLGGGVGSGVSPIVASIAKTLGILTLGIFTLPFKFEGERKMNIAQESLLKLKSNLNAFIVLPNEKIFEVIDKNTSLKGAFSAINKNLAESLTGLIETIYQPGIINIDFADLKTILEGRGRLAFLNTAYIKQEKTEGLEKFINNSLYPYNISGAKGVLLNITGGKNLSLSDVSQILKLISKLSSPEAKIIFGISPPSINFSKKTAEGEIKVTIFATGCSAKIFDKKIKVSSSISFLKEKEKSKKSSIKKLKKAKISKRKSQKKNSKKKEKNKIKERSDSTKTKKSKFKKIRVKVSLQPVESIEPKENYLEKNLKEHSFEIKNEEKIEEKIRRNAVQIRKEIEQAEREILEREKIWEVPAFLRKKEEF